MHTFYLDNNIMEKVIKNIIEDQLKYKGLDTPNTYVKSVFKFKDGNSFKGHTGNVVYGKYEDETCFLNIYNKYYDVIVLTEYYFATNKTILSSIIEFAMPNYFLDFINKLTDNGKLILDVENYELGSNTTLSYNCNNLPYFSISYKYSYDGFIALNHYENIKIVKHIKAMVSMFKSIIRDNIEDPDFIDNISYKKNNKVYISKSLFT